jgi:hypothetical protein
MFITSKHPHDGHNLLQSKNSLRAGWLFCQGNNFSTVQQIQCRGSTSHRDRMMAASEATTSHIICLTQLLNIIIKAADLFASDSAASGLHLCGRQVLSCRSFNPSTYLNIPLLHWVQFEQGKCPDTISFMLCSLYFTLQACTRIPFCSVNR